MKTPQSKSTKLDEELFRLASLVGCEPEDEERHRQDLAQYVESKVLKGRIDELDNARVPLSDEGGMWLRWRADKIKSLEAELNSKEKRQG